MHVHAQTVQGNEDMVLICVGLCQGHKPRLQQTLESFDAIQYRFDSQDLFGRTRPSCVQGLQAKIYPQASPNKSSTRLWFLKSDVSSRRNAQNAPDCANHKLSRHRFRSTPCRHLRFGMFRADSISNGPEKRGEQYRFLASSLAFIVFLASEVLCGVFLQVQEAVELRDDRLPRRMLRRLQRGGLRVAARRLQAMGQRGAPAA